MMSATKGEGDAGGSLDLRFFQTRMGGEVIHLLIFKSIIESRCVSICLFVPFSCNFFSRPVIGPQVT